MIFNRFIEGVTIESNKKEKIQQTKIPKIYQNFDIR